LEKSHLPFIKMDKETFELNIIDYRYGFWKRERARALLATVFLLFRLNNAQNGAPDPPIAALLILPAKRKPRENSQFGKNPRKYTSTTSLLIYVVKHFSYSSLTQLLVAR
jgi:hypothetical protein